MSKHKKRGRCPLCHEEGALVDSHILPNFLYKPIFGEDKRIVGVDNKPGSFIQLYQSGIWEPLLCADCDNAVIGPWEGYISEQRVFAFGPPIAKKLFWNEFVGLEYAPMKLFFLSVLWRMSISTRREFVAVELRPDDEERIRRRLLDQDPGPPQEYACLLVTNPDLAAVMTKSWMQPWSGRTKGTDWVMFQIGPFLWQYYLARRLPRKARQRPLYLRADGSLPFLVERDATGKLIWDVWMRARESENVDRGLDMIKEGRRTRG